MVGVRVDMINYEIPSSEEFEEKQNRIKELYRKKELASEEIDRLEKEIIKAGEAAINLFQRAYLPRA